MPLQIDVLNIQMGRIIHKDYTAGEEPLTKVYDINFKKSYKNITSVEQLVVLILAESLKSAGIRSAGIYGATLLTSVGVLPVSVVSKFVGEDSVEQNFKMSQKALFDKTLKTIKRLGEVTKEDEPAGTILAIVNGANITVRLKQIEANTVKMTISARKYMLPKREIASGILYEITEGQ